MIGTVAVKVVLLQFVEHAKDSNVLITEAYKVVAKGEVQLYYWWIYLLAIAVTLCTVYLSLMKPMRMAAKVSEIEAMRYQGGSKRQKSSRKGYQFLNIGRLTKRNLAENKKEEYYHDCIYGRYRNICHDGSNGAVLCKSDGKCKEFDCGAI